MLRISFLAVFGVWLISSLAQVVLAQQPDTVPLRQIVDQNLLPPAGMSVPTCTDSEFIRRVSLDLNGMTPTAAEVRAFLADNAPDKREKLVDRLLASPRFTRHLATSIDLWLMERRANPNVPQDAWHNWLLTSLRDGKSWAAIAREILTADGSDPAARPAARFYLDRGSEPNQIVRDVGRMFFGRDLQCAQCHDHPLVDDYKQADYHGLLAFVAPGYAVPIKNGDAQVTIHSEKAGTDLQFESVFYKGTLHRTPPRTPGDSWIDEPHFYPGEEYTVAPADNVNSVPKFSRRAKLAEMATSGTNRAFNENIANRLWAHLFGRGLVHPLDMHHPDNPAVSPELLRKLGEHLAALQFDMPSFLRELALSQTYQRPFDAPADLLSAAASAAETLATSEAERTRLYAELTAARESYEKALAAFTEAEKAFLPVAAELDAARTKFSEARKALDAAQAAATDAQKQVVAKQEVATALQAAATAAQAAAAKLPDDAELKAAAQKFVERTTQVETEIATLQKTFEEKSAAVAAPTSTLAMERTTVDAALARVEPLRVSMKQRDIELLAARSVLQVRSTDLSHFEARVRAARDQAQLASLRQSLDTAQAALVTRQSEQAVAQTQLVGYAPTIAERETLVVAAEKAMTDATAQLNTAKAAQTAHQSIVSDLTSAVTASESAQSKLNGDPVLADATRQLQERLTAIQAESASFQGQVEAADTALVAANTGREAARRTLDETLAEHARLEQVVTTAAAAVTASQAECVRLTGESQSLESTIIDRLSGAFALSTLRPLTPEQLGWSIFQVTGVNDRYWAAESAELEKAAPLTDAQKGDPAALSARVRDVEQKAYDKLKGNMTYYVQYYAAGAGQPQGDFFATADQALFAANGGAILSWVAPTGGNVTETVSTHSDLKLAAEELYLAVLSRLPTDAESASVVERLTARSADRPVAAQELVWALLNSAEFRFNH